MKRKDLEETIEALHKGLNKAVTITKKEEGYYFRMAKAYFKLQKEYFKKYHKRYG